MLKKNAIQILVIVFIYIYNTLNAQKIAIDAKKDNVVCLLKNNDYKQIDFSAIDNSIENKKIVLIGESSHGVKEFNEFKQLILEHLSSKPKEIIVGFESPMDNLEFVDLNRDNLSCLEMLTNGIYGIWHTKEYLKTFDIIKDKKIKILGIDPQFFLKRDGLFSKCREIGILTNEQCEKLFYADSISTKILYKQIVRNESKPNSATMSKDSFMLLKSYSLENYNSILMNISDKQYTDSSVTKILKRVLMNRLKYVDNAYIYEAFNNSIRDSLMAQNLIWYKENIFPNSQVIIFAHNSHIIKTIEGDIDLHSELMGKLLYDFYGENLYSIGLYMYSGEIALNNRQNFSVIKNYKNSLENELHRSNCNVNFTDTKTNSSERKNKWLSQLTPTLETGGNRIQKLFLNKSYDGIVFFKKVSIPEYLYPIEHYTSKK